MGTTDKNGKDPAPAAIRYLVLFSAFISLLMAASFFPAITGASSKEKDFFQNAIPGFVFIFLLTVVEWFVLRRSRKMIGPYGIAFSIEFVKTFLLNLGAIFYIQSVAGASTSDFFLLQITSLAIIFLLALTKIARARIDTLAQKDISRNILNLLPTLLILAVFLGTYVTEITGFGVPRQKNVTEDYIDKQIDWSMFNTPTWDATYLLENILDQFTAGLSQPDDPLFYVQSDQADPQGPIVYWRLGSKGLYKYSTKSRTTNWVNTQVSRRTITPIEEGTPYSQEVPSNERTAQFTVRIPLNYSDSVADVSVHPGFSKYLPATWNGQYGTYINRDTFNLYDSTSTNDPTYTNGNPLTALTLETREVFPMATTNDLLGIEANIMGLTETSNEEGVFEYTMDYMSPDIQTAAAFSMMGSETDYEQAIGTSDEWNSIKGLYLQLPNETGQLPDPGYVYDGYEANPENRYDTWAPYISANASIFKSDFANQSVFGKAYAVMLEFASDGRLPFVFDEQMWLGQQTGLNWAHPESDEDYNEWFFRRGSGVSIHFAGAYTMIMRLMGIPSRLVIGYIAGNDSIDYYPYRMISSRFLHAWTEVLVPLEANPLTGSQRHVEWISFDPLLSYLADEYGFELPSDIIPSSTEYQTTLFDPTYDLETNGLVQATLDQQADPSDWIFKRCVVNNKTLNQFDTLHHNDVIEVSVRLISNPSLVSWLPMQGENITFYIFSVSGNETGIPIGSAITNSQGRASINVIIDISIHGIRPVQFYAIVTSFSQATKTAISWVYYISI